VTPDAHRPPAPLVVLKLGGELLEGEPSSSDLVRAVAAIRQGGIAVVLVHGGGREIDLALARVGIGKRQVDGLRVTDEMTLDVVVAVLAGTVNTRFVARLSAAGVAAVGLTGADGGCGLAALAPPHKRTDSGELVDLGRVGVPLATADVRLLEELVQLEFVPVIASIGMDEAGRLLNVNADTFAGDLAARLRAKRLVIAGTTPGVLDSDGSTLSMLDSAGVSRLVAERTATAGMVAKLRACERALAAGVEDVIIVDGRRSASLVGAATGGRPTDATRLVSSVQV
jgi:acetylglutamate kinase